MVLAILVNGEPDWVLWHRLLKVRETGKGSLKKALAVGCQACLLRRVAVQADRVQVCCPRLEMRETLLVEPCFPHL